MASNLIGRLAEATNPVASIVGPELGHAPTDVAQTRDLAATCTSFLPPFSLPPTWRGFIETSAPRAGSGARGGAGRGAGRPRWRDGGRNCLPKACGGPRGPQAGVGAQLAHCRPGVSGRGVQHLGKATCHFQH